MQPNEEMKISANDPESVLNYSDEETTLWLSHIKLGEKQIEAKEKEWDRFLAYYRNEFFDYKTLSDRIVVNYIFAVIQTAKPQLYFKNPYTTVVPRKVRPMTEADVKPMSLDDFVKTVQGQKINNEISPDDRAKALESILNYEYDETKIKKESKKVILDAKIFGLGYLKIGYTFETDLKARKSKDGRVDYDEKIRKDHIHVYRLSPKQVVVPVGYAELETCPWIAIKYLKPLDDIKNSKIYSNVSKVQGESVNMADFYSTRRQQKTGPDQSKEKFVMIYEIWDRRNEKVITITDKGIKLREIDWPYLMEGFPIERLSFIDIPDQYFPESTVKYLEPQVMELNKYRTRQIMHNKRFNRKYVYNKEKFDVADVNKLKAGDDGTLVGCNGSPSEAIEPLLDAPLSSDQRFMQEDVKNDIRIMSGFDDLQLGSAARGTNTATEANIVEQNKKLRVDEEADMVTDFMNNVSRKMVQLIQQFYDQNMVVQITGEAAKGWSVIVDRDRIQGEFDVKVESGSTLPFNDDLRRQQLLTLLNILTAPALLPKVNVDGLLSQILRSYPNIKNPDQFINVEATNVEASLRAQNENELMFMGRPVHATPDDAHTVHLARHIGFLKSQPQGTMAEDSSINFQLHIQEHKMFMESAKNQIMRGGSPQGGSAPSPGSAFPGAIPNMPMNGSAMNPATMAGQPAEAQAGQ